ARARARDLGAVELLAQVATPAVLEEGQGAGQVEGDPPRTRLRARTLLARLARGLCGQLEQAPREPVNLLGGPQRQREGLGGVENVVAEARRELRQLGLDRVEARLCFAL